MSQGLQVWDENSNLILGVSDRLTRVLAIDEFPYLESFTRAYTFPEFINQEPFVICSSFNTYKANSNATTVYFGGELGETQNLSGVWYQITWSISGDTLTLVGNKSPIHIRGTTSGGIASSDIRTPPFMLIIGVY